MQLAVEYDGGVIPWDWPAFNTGFLSNSLATLIGVAAGIPLGLWLSRRTEEREDQSERQRTIRQHLVAVTALLDELQHNSELINDRLHKDFVRQEFPHYRLDVDLWPVAMPILLQAIDDAALLDEISRLYHQLEELNRMLDVRQQVMWAPPTLAGGGSALALADELAGKFNKARIDLREPLRLMLPKVKAVMERFRAEAGILEAPPTAPAA